MTGWERAEAERQELARVESEASRKYAAALNALADGSSVETDQLTALAGQTGLPTEELTKQRTAAFTAYVQRAVGDEVMTPEEEDHVQKLIRGLGIDVAALFRKDPTLGRHIMVAEANGGFLPEISSSRLIQKKGERVHLEVQATLLKEVTVRQSQGGYSGFSFPIGKTGIRYRG